MVILNPTLPGLARRKLPIGIQTFSEMIQEGHYDVDKTGMALGWFETGTPTFLVKLLAQRQFFHLIWRACKAP